MSEAPLYGLMAEFHDPGETSSRRRARCTPAGYTKIDAYTPYPMRGAGRGPAACRTRTLSKLVLAGGLAGRAGGWGLQYWTSVIDYPLNIGGRPFNAWPAFIVPAFETTILFAALAAVLGMLALNGLPQPYHPVFNVPGFATAQPRPLLPLHRGGGPEVRSEPDPGVPGGSRRPRSRRWTSERPRRRPSSSWWPSPGCGCRQDMHDQPKYKPLPRRASSSTTAAPSRPFVDGTVARGTLREDDALLHRQVRTTSSSTELPVPVTAELLERGQRRVPDLLLALPRPHRHRRRHDRPARLQAAHLLPRGPAAPGARRLLLRRDHQRLRRDVGLRGPGAGRGPLGDRRLRARAAAQPVRPGRGRPRGPPAPSSRRACRPRTHAAEAGERH